MSDENLGSLTDCYVIQQNGKKALAVSGGGQPLDVKDFLLAVNMGSYPGYRTISKFGANPLITTTSEPEDIWEEGGTYNFNTIAEGSTIDKASSSDTGDTGQLIMIFGIEDPITSIDETIGWFETNGQNKVNIYDNPELTGDPISFWRVDRMENESDEGGDLAGDLYVYVDTAISLGVPVDRTKIRARISNGNNQTLMALYTVRPKKVGFFYRAEGGVKIDAIPAQSQNFMEAYYQSRRYGKVFKVKKDITLMTAGNSNYQDPRSFPDILPALTDIKLTVHSVGVDMGAWGAVDILYVDEDKFSEAYLTAIGQPGY